MNRMKPLDLSQITFTSVKKKRHKVKEASFASVWKKGGSLADFLDSLPELLAGKDMREVVTRVAEAVRRNKIVLLGMGAHPIKLGLSPVLIDWMEKGILRGIGINGAGHHPRRRSVHDRPHL